LEALRHNEESKHYPPKADIFIFSVMSASKLEPRHKKQKCLPKEAIFAFSFIEVPSGFEPL
jgi:hypothetical protein